MKRFILTILLGIFISFPLLANSQTTTTTDSNYETGKFAISVGYVPGIFLDKAPNGTLITLSHGFTITMQSFESGKKSGFISQLGFHFPTVYNLSGQNDVSMTPEYAGIDKHFKLTCIMGPSFKINTNDFYDFTISPVISYNMDSLSSSTIGVFAIDLGFGGILNLSIFANKPFNFTLGTNLNFNFFEFGKTYTAQGTKDNVDFITAFQLQPFIAATYRFDYKLPRLFN